MAPMHKDRRAHKDRGASGIEYALLIGLIAAVGIVALSLLGDRTSGLFASVSNRLGSVGQSSGGSGGSGGGSGNSPPALIAGNVFSGGAGPQTGRNATAAILALFQDPEGNAPLSVVTASGGDACVTSVGLAGGVVLIDTANGSCSGTVTVQIADSLGAASAPVVLSASVGQVTAALISPGAGSIIHNADGTGGPASAAFDGVTSQGYTQVPRRNGANNPVDAYMGKNWGSGVRYVATRFVTHGSSNLGLNNGSGGLAEATMVLYLEGSNDGSGFTVLATSPATVDSNGIVIDVSVPSPNPVTDGYQYHRVRYRLVNELATKECCNIAELQLYGYPAP